MLARRTAPEQQITLLGSTEKFTGGISDFCYVGAVVRLSCACRSKSSITAMVFACDRMHRMVKPIRSTHAHARPNYRRGALASPSLIRVFMPSNLERSTCSLPARAHPTPHQLAYTTAASTLHVHRIASTTTKHADGTKVTHPAASTRARGPAPLTAPAEPERRPAASGPVRAR